ncbi:hypothetical protein GCM10008090_06820 [Arenicella chitinivorans]|uniref:DUF4398 domain-containing protein n=1 Tax=Arenicella chitinivorans TaxID=1329800 RepID=A0A918RL20_9GAMM|nr:hypothetical protein [Arenicella chitinivorans]GHA00575.1 hypothetical protein GCM10008090_06820 [Arenicella chitinivorans]
MIKIIICISLIALLSACSRESTAPNNQNHLDAVASNNTKFSTFLSEAQICQILEAEKIAAYTAGQGEPEKAASSYRETYTCTYTWPRPDAEERQQKVLEATMASMRGEGERLSMRERMTDYQITISARQSKRNANTFVPQVLTEAQIQAQIETAKKRAAERLTDEQKAVAGSAADDMVERLIRKNNENQRVKGIGDAAYWSNLSSGSLQVLAGDIELSISPMLADSKQADMENAKQIAVTILK